MAPITAIHSNARKKHPASVTPRGRTWRPLLQSNDGSAMVRRSRRIAAPPRRRRSTVCVAFFLILAAEDVNEDSEKVVVEEAVTVEEEDVNYPCHAETEVLKDCFDNNNEEKSANCWEDCVVPAYEVFRGHPPSHKLSEACETFCNEVEQCRSKMCSSGSACKSQYYDTLNCGMMTTCTCTGDYNKCHVEGKAITDCFEENDEEDDAKCWEECIAPALVIYEDPSDESFESCLSFCTAIEQCRGERCSTASACESQYYDALNCAVPRCTCMRGLEARASGTAEDGQHSVVALHRTVHRP